MKKFLIVVAWSLLAAACSPGAPMPISPWQEASGRNFPEPRPGEAALYLIRDAAPQDAPPINFTMGRQPVGGLTGSTWMLFDLWPKLYDLRAHGTRESSELIITVDPGQTRFLLVQPTPSGSAEFLELSPADGRRLVRRGQHIQEIR